VLLSKIIPAIDVTIIVIQSVVSIEIPKSKIMNNATTIITGIIIMKIPPSFSSCGFSFFVNGVNLAITFPIHAVG